MMCLSLFSSKQCIIKQLLDSVFVISEHNQGLSKCYHPRPSARLITLTPILIIPDVTKTSSIIIVYYFIQSEMGYSKKQQGGKHGEGLWRQVNDLLKFVIFEAVSLH